MPLTTAQFTTRARVVDLLGREQIADAPTAMGELFKNAIDAAASRVRIDFWQKEKCLVISDDGLGMRTNEDLVAKWLVIATESKRRGSELTTEEWKKFATPDQRARLSSGKTFGQKGIGRLAIGLLGSGTLVWTRWGEGDEKQRTLMLVPWNVFRHPQLTLDQIELPMMTLDRVATIEDARELVRRAQSWVDSKPQIHTDLFEQLSLLRVDLEQEFQGSLRAPIEFPDSHGTQFVVLNTDDCVANHFEGWLGKDDLFGADDSFSPEGPKAYFAFNNPFSAKPKLQIELFCDGKVSKAEGRDFWTIEDFTKADHYVKVEIDSDGFAKGFARRFDEEIHYEKQLGQLPTGAKSPGNLVVEIGSCEGDPEVSRLSPEDFPRYYKRLVHFGGFYVYMDDVRVCPYGRDDADFVGFEKRRNLSAGRHFWSHRRMFGGVFLRKDSNPNLEEKAGREGFQQNGAYRGLVHYLKSLFVDLADSYFGNKAKRPDKVERKKEQQRKEREVRQDAERDAFLVRFSLSKKALESVESEFRQSVQKLESDMFEAETQFAPLLIDGCSAKYDQLRSLYTKMWSEMVREFPTGFSLDPEMAEAVDEYLHRRGEIDRTALQQLKQMAARLERLSKNSARDSRDSVQPEQILKSAHRDAEQLLSRAVAPLLDAQEKLRRSIEQRPIQDLKRLDVLAQEALKVASDSSQSAISAIEEAVAQQTREIQERLVPFYEKLRRQIDLLVEGDGGLLEAEDLREQIRVLKDRERHLLELAQLGLVMETADHDYRSMLANADVAIANLVRILPQAAAQDIQNLKDALQHIDEQLQGWDPLVRRVRGRVSEISGEEIRKFLHSAFDKSRRPTVTFEYTQNFLGAIFSGVKRPVFLGAIHNLVMNAGYWANKAGGNGTVRFSMMPTGFVISDSGSGIHNRDRERVFEPGFSRRPAGRGLGLFIARSCLNAFGYTIELLPVSAPGALSGANFMITAPSPK